MSITPTAWSRSSGSTGPSLTATSAVGVRRVRHQARDVVLLMAFSATASTALALGLLVLARLARVER